MVVGGYHFRCVPCPEDGVTYFESPITGELIAIPQPDRLERYELYLRAHLRECGL